MKLTTSVRQGALLKSDCCTRSDVALFERLQPHLLVRASTQYPPTSPSFVSAHILEPSPTISALLTPSASSIEIPARATRGASFTYSDFSTCSTAHCTICCSPYHPTLERQRHVFSEETRCMAWQRDTTMCPEALPKFCQTLPSAHRAFSPPEGTNLGSSM